MFATYAPIAGHLKDGSTSRTRRDHGEQGGGASRRAGDIRDAAWHRSDVWYVMAAPAGTPGEIIARLNKEVLAAINSPLIAKQFADDEVQTIGSRPEEVTPYIAAEIAKWSEVIKRSGARID